MLQAESIWEEYIYEQSLFMDLMKYGQSAWFFSGMMATSFMMQKWFRFNFLLHVPFDSYECTDMLHHELMCWFAPVEGDDALMVTPTILE